MPLIFDVMYRENGADKLIFRPFAINRFQINRRKRRLPVVAMKHVGIKFDKRQNFHHGTGEKRKTLSVVVIAVAAASSEIVFVIEKIKRHAVFHVRKNAAILISPRKRNVDIEEIFETRTIIRANIRIQRQHHAHVVIFVLRERFGKRSHHFRQSARSDKRRAFRGNEKNFALRRNFQTILNFLHVWIPIRADKIAERYGFFVIRHGIHRNGLFFDCRFFQCSHLSPARIPFGGLFRVFRRCFVFRHEMFPPFACFRFFRT